ncbi:hypothetical protein [Sulfitobacter sp.]|uniref:hypothetical protein n=1 Tax=Sulfitobacter sp. TaxID=1903071 RepID=UPI003001384A
MNCAALPTVPPLAILGFGVALSDDLTGAGLAVHAPDEHADVHPRVCCKAQTGGGLGVRTVCPFTSLFNWTAGCFVRLWSAFFGGVLL